MLELFLSHYLLFFLAQVILFVLSQFITDVALKNYAIVSGWKTYLGFVFALILVSIATSFYFTIFKTINIALAITLLLTFILFKKKTISHISYKGYKKDSISFTIIGLFFYTYYFFSFYDSTFHDFSIINTDYFFYANISEYLTKTGNETYYFDYLFGEPGVVNQYHFFELWINSFFLKLFNINASISQVLVTYPLLISIFSFGFFTLFSKRKLFERILFTCFCVSFTGLSPIISQFKDFRLLSDMEMFYSNIILAPKLSITYIFLLPSVYYLSQKRYNYSLFFLLLAGLLNPTTFYTTIVIITALLAINPGTMIENKSRKKFLFLIFSFFVSYALFYKLNKRSEDIISMPKIDEIINSFSNPQILRTKINIVIKSAIQNLILYSIFILAIVQLWPWNKTSRNEIKILFSFILIVFTISILTWASIHFVLGSAQLFANLASVYFNLFFAIFLILSIITNYGIEESLKKKIIIYSGMIFLFILNCFYIEESQNRLKMDFRNQYSNDAYQEIKSEFQNKENLVCAMNIDIKDENSIYLYNPLANQSFILNLFAKNSYCIAIFPELLNPAKESDLIMKRILTDFKEHSTQTKAYKKYKLNNLPYDERINAFLDSSNIKYIFVPQNDSLKKKIKNIKRIIVSKGIGLDLIIRD